MRVFTAVDCVPQGLPLFVVLLFHTHGMEAGTT